jgi:putative hydrolase of HD superfamily
VESLKPEELLRILSQAARLKTTMRHCYTEEGRRESVADHSWRIALIAMLMTGIEEYQDFDMNKVIRMCLIHDLGESFTGDIPTFAKDSADKKVEDDLFERWVDAFPEPQRAEWLSLLAEMKALETKEAKLYKALDKIEAIISHNESDISTWLPLEYDLQLTYGKENMQFSKYMTELRAEVDAWTIEKIEAEAAQ